MSFIYYLDIIGIVLFIEDKHMVRGALTNKNVCLKLLSLIIGIVFHTLAFPIYLSIVLYILHWPTYCFTPFCANSCSSHQPLTVPAWNDMTDFFKTMWPAYNQIFGFTSLRVTSHKGILTIILFLWFLLLL